MRVSNDDAQIDVQIDGTSGDAVVMLAGFPLSREIWDAQARVLATRYRVIRPDLRGLGASGVCEGVSLMEAVAGDIAAVLDQLGIERAAFVGHSLGGFVAIAFARMYTERVAKLALVASRLDEDCAEVARTRYDLADAAEAQRSIEPIVQFYVPRLIASDVTPQDSRVLPLITRIAQATDYRGAAAMLRGMAIRVPGDDIAADLQVPVLVVAGERDRVLPIEVARAAAAAFPNAQLVVATQSGHVPMLEEPDVVTAALEEWLSR